MHESNTYQPSGFFRINTVLLFAAALVGAGLLAWVYQLLMHYVPFIYLNAVICLGFAGAVGWAGHLAVKWGHCRNRMLAIVFAFPLGVGALGASYGWEYQRFLSNVAAENPGVTMQEVRAELSFKRFVELKREVGWSVSSHGENGTSFNGIVVIVVWAIEAIVVVGGVVFITALGAGEPYCERCNRWCSTRGMKIFHVSRADIEPSLSARDLSALIGKRAVEDPPDRSVALVLEAVLCEACTSTAFLTIKESRVVEKKGGKTEEKIVDIAKYLVLRPNERQQLVDRLSVVQELVA